MPDRFRDRDTVDLLLLLLGVILAGIVFVVLGLIVWTEIKNPGESITGVVHSLAEAAGTIIAALIGYVAGRTAGPGRRDRGQQ